MNCCTFCLHHVSHVKWKSAFEHAQKVQVHIILHMCKVLFRHLLSTGIFYSIQWFCLQTAKTLIRLCRWAGWSGSSLSSYTWRHVFTWPGPYVLMFVLIYEYIPLNDTTVRIITEKNKQKKLDCAVHGTPSQNGVVGWCEGVVYLMSLGRPTDIGLKLGKACYPCSR